jgi:hypothetical protein
MKALRNYKYQDLPNDDNYWLVFNWGKVFPTSDGSFAIEVVLAKLTKVTSDVFPDYSIDQSHHQIIKVPLAAIRSIQIGSIWHRQSLFKNLSDYREPTQPIFIKDLSQSSRKKLCEVVDDKEFPYPKYLEALPVRTFSKGVDYQYGRYDLVVFPCSSIVKYYFFKSANLVHHVLSGNLEPGNNKVFDPLKSFIRNNDDGNKEALIWLKKETDNTDDYKIARMAFDDYYLSKAREVYANRLSNIADNFIDGNFPINDKGEISVRGKSVQVKGSDSKKDFRLLFVYSIHKCLSSPPFHLLIRGSDRDNRKADVDEETKEIEKKLIERRYPLQDVDVRSDKSLGSAPSNSNYDNSEIKIDDSEEYNFNSANIIPINKDHQKYITSHNVITTFDDEPNLTISGEKKTNSDSFQAKLVDEEQERFNSVFEDLSVIINRLQLEIADLLIQNVVPFSYAHPDYIGFSIFPISKLKSNRNAYNWCHLTKVYKGYWKNPRRIKIVEISINMHFVYVLEVEQRSKDECTLLVLRNFSLDKISNDYLSEILYEAAKKKGVWNKTSALFSGSFEFISMKHTNIDSLFQRVKKIISSMITLQK